MTAILVTGRTGALGRQVVPRLRAAGRRRRVLPVRLPGRVMRDYTAGAHLAPDHPDGRVSFADFLREHVSPGTRAPRYGALR